MIDYSLKHTFVVDPTFKDPNHEFSQFPLKPVCLVMQNHTFYSTFLLSIQHSAASHSKGVIGALLTLAVSHCLVLGKNKINYLDWVSVRLVRLIRVTAQILGFGYIFA